MSIQVRSSVRRFWAAAADGAKGRGGTVGVTQQEAPSPRRIRISNPRRTSRSRGSSKAEDPQPARPPEADSHRICPLSLPLSCRRPRKSSDQRERPRGNRSGSRWLTSWASGPLAAEMARLSLPSARGQRTRPSRRISLRCVFLPPLPPFPD